MEDTFAAKVNAALSQIRPLIPTYGAPAQSIECQLLWCRALALGEGCEPRSGPFSMGQLATREFDMWGDQPELAKLINEIQHLAEERIRD